MNSIIEYIKMGNITNFPYISLTKIFFSFFIFFIF